MMDVSKETLWVRFALEARSAECLILRMLFLFLLFVAGQR